MPERDIRKYSNATIFQLVIGALLIIFFVGIGLISMNYGLEAAISGLLCLLGFMIPIVLIWAILKGLEWIANKYKEE